MLLTAHTLGLTMHLVILLLGLHRDVAVPVEKNEVPLDELSSIVRDRAVGIMRPRRRFEIHALMAQVIPKALSCSPHCAAESGSRHTLLSCSS